MGIKKFFKGFGKKKNEEKEEIRKDIEELNKEKLDDKVQQEENDEKKLEKKENEKKSKKKSENKEIRKDIDEKLDIKKDLDLKEKEDTEEINVNKEKKVQEQENFENEYNEQNLNKKGKKGKKEKEEKIDEEEPKEKNRKGLFQNLKEKLSKSRNGLFGKIKKLFIGRTIIDDEMYEELEELLIQSDIGFDMTVKIVELLEEKVRENKIKEPEKVYDVLKDVMASFLINEGTQLEVVENRMNVILVVGVNGVGKTTTIGKLAMKYKREGKKVILGAADTFRAAAIEQLEEWSNRAEVEIVKHMHGADPGAVVFDTLKIAKKQNADVVLLDTAGRLHNKNNLMLELSKVNKIIKKEIGEEEYESILVIDGTTGQNALTQAKVFNEVTQLTGFIITKLDGTAKGGIVFAISEELKKPVKYIGVGEGIEDLREFKPKQFIDAIFE